MIALINIARQLALDNADLRNTIDGLTERVATLSKKAESPAPVVSPPAAPTTTSKKGKG